MKNDVVAWVNAYRAICNKEKPHCPKCNSTNITYDFRANENKVGYVQMACCSCGDSVYVSRVEFPDHVDTTKL